MAIARQKGLIVAVVGLAMIFACRSKAVGPGQNNTPVRVLMLTATAGFRHDSINAARQVMPALASSSGQFTVAMTEELSAISSANLAGYDVVFFALTSGELAFTEEQKA